jgi:hypothetical protein
VTRSAARKRLLLSVEWVCHTLWLAQRREPELIQLQEERGSTGFVHYILSRAGNVPDVDWAAAIYVMPTSLVDHLRPRSLGLDPASYLQASQKAGAAALRRLHPKVSGQALGQLARSSEPDGQLPRAWWELPPPDDPHEELLWAAMTLREGRAYAHYRAAEEEELLPLELLVLTAAWQNADAVPFQRLFRWADEEVDAARESLKSGSWLDQQGGLSASGRARRDALEAKTEAQTDRVLESLTDVQLEQLAAALPISQ